MIMTRDDVEYACLHSHRLFMKTCQSWLDGLAKEGCSKKEGGSRGGGTALEASMILFHLSSLSFNLNVPTYTCPLRLDYNGRGMGRGELYWKGVG